ncbi:uncharacterized protein LDX57_002252 [Aspergillus melleus]|uniref:uncharacterized protein n=1 Tax=Aspergillus melleus TaxID=138277 RepID=UPI001E8D555E|nr:uncharacterized protein LDX57_002252 [Aspergillus melleus]KAH8424501.1 hypothetical protein LDX57_002252 [Aspergillus melleus]
MGRGRRDTFCTAELPRSVDSFDSYFNISRVSYFPGEMAHLRRACSPDSLVMTPLPQPLPPQYDGTAERRKAKKNKKSNKKKNNKKTTGTASSQQTGGVDDEKVDGLRVESLSSNDVADKGDVLEDNDAVASPFIVHGETPVDRVVIDLSQGLGSGSQLGYGSESIGDVEKEIGASSESTTIREMSVRRDEERVKNEPSSVANNGSDPFVCHTHRRVACKFDPRCCVHRDPKNCSCPPRWSCCCLHHLGDCCHCVSIPDLTTYDDDDVNNNQDKPSSDQGQDPSTEDKGSGANNGKESSNLNPHTQVDNHGSKGVSNNSKDETLEKPDSGFEELSQVTEGDTEKVSSDDDQKPKKGSKCDKISDEMGEKIIDDENMDDLDVEEKPGDKAKEMPEIMAVDAAKHEPSHESEGQAEDKPEAKTVESIEHKNRDKAEKKCGDEEGEERDKTDDRKEASAEKPMPLASRPARPTDLMGPLASHLFAKLLRNEYCDSIIVLRSVTDNFLPMEFAVHKVVATQSPLAAACFHSSNRIFAVVRENFAMIKAFELALWNLYGHPLVTRHQLRASTLSAYGYTQDARGQLNFHVNGAMADFAICYATSGVFFQLHNVAEAGFTMIAELVDWDTVELILCIGLEILKFTVNLEAGAGPGHEQVHNQNIARELQEMWAPMVINAVLEFVCKYVKETEGFSLVAGAQSTGMPDRIPESLRTFPSAVTARPKLSDVKFGSFSTVHEQKPAKEAVISSAILINLPYEQLGLTFTIMTARNVLSVELAQAVISAREARRLQALLLLSQQGGPGRSAGNGELGYREYLAGTAPGPQTLTTEVELCREWVGLGAVSEP